jgi:hypothetical protein
MKRYPLAGTPATSAQHVDVSRLLAAYADLAPDMTQAAQRVAHNSTPETPRADTRLAANAARNCCDL